MTRRKPKPAPPADGSGDVARLIADGWECQTIEAWRHKRWPGVTWGRAAAIAEMNRRESARRSKASAIAKEQNQ